VRILFLCGEYTLGNGGIASYVRSLAPALAARGHEVHVLSCLRGQPRRDRREGDVHVHERDKARVRGLARLAGGYETVERLDAALACRRALRELGPFDVVEAADWGAEGLLVGDAAPLVVALHTPLRVIARHNGRPLGRDGRAADLLERTAVRRARVVTSPSALLAGELNGWLDGAPVRVVPNPVDTDSWEGLAGPGAAGPLVLSPGRIEPLKGSELLVEAAARLAQSVPGLEVVFVGRSSGERDGRPFRDWLVDRAASLGAPCTFVDEVPRRELRSWLGRARVVAVPALWNNFPMVALEAMAAGRPVVCSSMTGTAEILAGSGAGTVVPPGDPSALAAALEPYLADAGRAEREGRRARELVVERCSPERIAAERERCYEEAAR
jgi:glycosyltransferase involved in cell wall biosynthesis